MKKQNKEVFEILNGSNFKFNFREYLVKLLEIDIALAVEFVVSRSAIAKCVEIIENESELLHKFLYQIFLIDKNLTRDYNERQA